VSGTIPSFAQTKPTPSNTESEYVYDPFDPFDWGDSGVLSSEKDDKNKSAEQLLLEATQLLMSEHLLDARTKLLRALKKDPKNYRTHYTLATYYLVHVGHFRLALKYIQRAKQLFAQQHGAAPYIDPALQMEHATILYYQSQIRLNLDNYAGALNSLDTYASLGYMADWYPGSRAWILMKLGRLHEAITVARAGIISGADPSRTLNMLGILLSMSGQPTQALEVFKKAIGAEFALGISGQPATPLNNAGEVYKELFQDDKAASAFLRATSLPDGCEHVLPSLNLVLLYIDQLRLAPAASILNAFERCVAQFPLRNNEEHSALVHLARGRLALHTGNIDAAIGHLRQASEGTQWFGKIGTNQDDLIVATAISLAQALHRENNILRLKLYESFIDQIRSYKQRIENSIEAWWKLRQARQILVNDLSSIEDLHIRHTDSLLEYPTLGEVLKDIASVSLSERIGSELKVDKRAPAQLYYALYSAENRLGWFNGQIIKTELDRIISQARPKNDAFLQLHALIQRLRLRNSGTMAYSKDAYAIFSKAPAALRNYGLKLPVDVSRVSKDIQALALRSAFISLAPNSGLATRGCTITAPSSNELSFTCPTLPTRNRTVKDSNKIKLMNKLIEAIFTEEIDNGSRRK
jgi:Tfp pilus assembly protein PilF